MRVVVPRRRDAPCRRGFLRVHRILFLWNSGANSLARGANSGRDWALVSRRAA